MQMLLPSTRHGRKNMDYYNVEFSDEANNDLANIREYVAEQSGVAMVAANLVDKITDATNILSFSPHFAKVDDLNLAKSGYRKRTVGNYTIFFRINETEKIVTIETIIHGARNWQKILRNIEEN